MAGKDTDRNISVGYSADGASEQFAIRQSGKSRRVITMDRREARTVHAQLGQYLEIPAPNQAVETAES